MGLPINMQGEMTRPPLNFERFPLAFAFSEPYLLSLQPKSIDVYNLHDQHMIQNIELKEGIALTDSNDSGVFVATASKVFSLVPIGLEKQISALISAKRVTEAISLVELASVNEEDQYGDASGDTKKFARMRQLQGDAGYVLLNDLQFQQAMEHFKNSDVDPRAVLSLFPHLYTLEENETKLRGRAQSAMVRESSSSGPKLTYNDSDGIGPSAESIVEIIKKSLRQEGQSDNDEIVQTYVINAEQSLISYLLMQRESQVLTEILTAVDTALLKIYANREMLDHLDEFLKEPKIYVDLDEGIKHLKSLNRYNAQALLYKANGDMPDKALFLWKALGEEELFEPGYDGKIESVGYLRTISDEALVFQYSGWLLEALPELGVKVFTDPDREVDLKPESVLKYLEDYGDKPVTAYLEYLVHEAHNTKEEYHTQLAMLYLDTVLVLITPNTDGPRPKPGSEAGLLGQVRGKLIDFLSASKYYHIPTLLTNVRETELYEECALLYSKQKQHEEALKLIVFQLGDMEAAQEYCDINGAVAEQDLYIILMRVLLQGDESVDPESERALYLKEQALVLLQTKTNEMEPAKVLDLLPDDLTLDTLSDYFVKALTNSMHSLRESQVLRNVAKMENLRLKEEKISLENKPIRITRKLTCPVCEKYIGDKVFAYFPNGVVVHYNCLIVTDGVRNEHIDPWTRTDFRTGKQSFEEGEDEEMNDF
eukprot:TRINITY_DN1188_c0_g1_i1.p1 TRINITY_DN1188_c0_g1~~TRINITY_DN1188_c0_g1_i1.p1  ORF type:complete len:710 (+),score=252.67 TRINITY_DN1188_c0_g1_i1:685-2814(+)